MKSFGDAVGPSEAPHAGDLLRPGVEGVAECDELRQSGLAQLDDGAQETRDQLLALLARFVFLQQQIAEPLFETVDVVAAPAARPGRLQQPGFLLGFEVVAMAAHQGDQTSVLGADGSISRQQAKKWWLTRRITWKRSATITALGNCFLTMRAVDARQIHADDPDLFFALQAQENTTPGRPPSGRA